VHMLGELAEPLDGQHAVSDADWPLLAAAAGKRPGHPQVPGGRAGRDGRVRVPDPGGLSHPVKEVILLAGGCSYLAV